MDNPKFSVSGMRAIVTGGRRGLGKAITLGLLEAGADVVCVASHPAPEDMCAQAKNMPGTLYSIVVDLADPSSRDGVCQHAQSLLGGLDLLVNNAGHQEKAPLENYSQSMFHHAYSLMVEAPFDLARQAASLMTSGGAIINISSISGFQGARNIVGYSSAKHAVIGLTKCLANELAPQGIRVNCIAPGLFATDMAAETLQDESKRLELLGRIPAGRFGVPEDMVGPVIFLASQAARHIHGATLLVDGGWMGR